MEEAKEAGQDCTAPVQSVHCGQLSLQEEIVAIGSVASDLSPCPQSSVRASPRREPVEAISRATTASVWCPSSPPSPSLSIDATASRPMTCPYIVEPATARSVHAEDSRDCIEEADLYRSLAENESAIVPFGTSLERYLAGVIHRYGKGEWSIEDARQVCAYVTGPHRLAPLLWRTARMAPRPPRGYASNFGQSISFGRLTTESFQGPRQPHHPHSDVGVPGSHFERFWEGPASDSCARNGNTCGDEISEISGTLRRTRDYELYHHGSSIGEDRRTSDGPFPMSGAHGTPHRSGSLARPSMHQMSTMHTGNRSSRSENAELSTPAASNDALVFWDEPSVQQMYLRRHDGTEYGSLSDYGGTRERVATPDFAEYQQNESSSRFSHTAGDAEQAGIRDSRSIDISLRGVLHSRSLSDGISEVYRGDAAGNVLGFGLDTNSNDLPPRDSFEAASQYSQEDPANYLSSNPRSTVDEAPPGRDSADENNPFLAHIQEATMSRVSTSSLQGTRISPVCPDSFNASSSFHPEAFEHIAAPQTRQHGIRSTAQPQYTSTGVPSVPIGMPFRFRDGPRRPRRGTGSGYATAEDVVDGNDVPESGRTCDIFRGQHGERTLSGYPSMLLPPLRRAHSTPEMQLEPLISDSSGMASSAYWRDTEDSRRPSNQAGTAIDATSMTSRDDSNGGRRSSSADIPDGSDQLTQYYASILDKMHDPRTHSLMQRTLDIFNNQPPSTASTAETSEIALAGTQAAAIAAYERNSRRSTCSRNGTSSTLHASTRRCLFARGPQELGLPQDLPPKHSAGGRSSRGSASAAAAAMVASSRCLFARSGAVCVPGGAPVSPVSASLPRGCATDGFVSSTPSPPSPQLAFPGPYRAASGSRTSFSSSNMCLEVVPETAEVHCNVVGSSHACGDDATHEASIRIPEIAVPGGPFLDFKAHAAAGTTCFSPSDACQDTMRRITGDSWFSQCCSSDSRGDAEDGEMFDTLKMQSPAASQIGSSGQREASIVGEELAAGCPSECSSTCGASHGSASGSGFEHQPCTCTRAGNATDARCSVTASIVPNSFSPRPGAPPNTADSPQGSSTDCTSSLASRSSSCVSLLQNVDHHYSDNHRPALRPPRKVRRNPQLAIKHSTAPKPPLVQLAKACQIQMHASSVSPAQDDRRGAGRTTSAEDMALLRLEPRRRHCTLRISSDRAPCEAQDARSRSSGSSGSPGSRRPLDGFHEAPVANERPSEFLDSSTLASSSPKSHPIVSQEAPAEAIHLNSGSSNEMRSRPGQSDAVLRSPVAKGPELGTKSQDMSAHSCVAAEPQQVHSISLVNGNKQNGPGAAADASSVYTSMTGRRNSTLNSTNSRSLSSNPGVQPAGLLNHSFNRRSFACSSSSVGRFSGLIYTSATDADGQITTNRNPAVSVAAPVTVTVRNNSVSKVAGFGKNGGGDHSQGRMLRSTTEKQISISFRKTVR